MSPVRPGALLLLSLLCVPPLEAQRGDRAPLPVDRFHPVCTAWMSEWAIGSASDGGLLTFGTPFLQRFRVGAPPGPVHGPKAAPDALVARREAAPGGLGAELWLERGPSLAGASEPTQTPGVYHYPGPRASNGTVGAVRVRDARSWRSFVAAFDVATDGHTTRVRTAGFGVSRGPLLLYGGALLARTGPVCRDGLVLGGSSAPIWGVQFVQTRPIHLPVVGRLQVGVQLGALREAGPGNGWPIFHAMRIELHPGEDLVLGLNRAVIFGGSRSAVPLTLRTVGLMLIGLTDTRGKDSDFENQVASLDLRWRARAGERALLLTAEYGADDGGFAFVRVPGAQVGGEIQWSPVGTAWTGISLTALAPPSGTYPAWYRHGALAWGWTERGTPLGSPLGGHGWSALATWRRVDADGALGFGVGPVFRGEHNLFAPDLEGAGWAATIELDRTFGPWELEVRGRIEGTGVRTYRWTSSVVRAF
jgi:hypothetical protein